ncbi:MAG TPA: sulfite exporter TauE/SafE family protein [Symbiobacteriaceae bacterium]|nr:sulfite exporter TauE/SafE family protein [Symbiobacteriaceae bacterium]
MLWLATAVLLGMRHALDPDHLVAVSTLVSEERSLWPAARLGAIWGAGHLLPIAAVGLPVLLLRLELPHAMESVVDLGVGLLLVVLGIRTLMRLRQERIHAHVHDHGGRGHAHFHGHAGDRTHGHIHEVTRRNWLSFGVGALHGLAGSGPAALLALAAAPSVGGGVIYLLAFGAGTALGMFMATLCIAAPAIASISRVGALQGAVRVAAGFASVCLGLTMWVGNLPSLLN